jgi:hypothetical protein
MEEFRGARKTRISASNIRPSTFLQNVNTRVLSQYLFGMDHFVPLKRAREAIRRAGTSFDTTKQIGLL